MKLSEMTTFELLDLSHSIAGEYLKEYDTPYKAIPDIKSIILKLQKFLNEDYDRIGEDVYIHKTAKIAPTAYIGGPTIICAGAEVRHCAFIRSSALVGAGAVVGNSVELKNTILFDNVQVPHFNYVGDSILGYKSHMGAGAVTSNIKSDKTNVTIITDEGRIETGLRKMGAVLGDYVEVGCNSTLNPGVVIGRRSSIYPNSSVRGTVSADSIYKTKENIILKNRRD